MRKLILLLTLAFPAFGALNQTVQWDVRTTGSDSNGGGFDPGNASFATDGAATSATGASPVFSSASYTFVAGDVGALLFIQTGSGWFPGWYPIASVTGGAATLSAGIGAGVNWAELAVNGLTIVAGVASTASPSGATWGIDYSQQSAAQIAYSDFVVGATTTHFTSVLHPVGVNLVGNLISVNSGTGCTAQIVEVMSVLTLTATVDKSLGTAASICGANLGGSNLTICGTYSSGCKTGASVYVNPNLGGNYIWVKTGTYSIGSVTIANVNATGQNFDSAYVGYGSLHGDWSTSRPLITTNQNVPVFQLLGVGATENVYIWNIVAQETATTYTTCIINEYAKLSTSGIYLLSDKIDGSANTTGAGDEGLCIYQSGASSQSFSAFVFKSEFSMANAYDCIGDYGSNGIIDMEWSYCHGARYGIGDENAVTGGEKWILRHNAFATNTRHAYMSDATATWLLSEGNAFYNATDENILVANSAIIALTVNNNIFYGGTIGVSTTGGSGFAFAAQNAFGNIGTANYLNSLGGAWLGGADYALGACQPFNNPGSADFSLSTCGKAALAGNGYPGVTSFGTGYLDIGALQSKSASGSGVSPHAYVQ